MTTLKIVKPSTKPQKVTKTTVDTILVTPALVSSWSVPQFQRPLRVNEKVRQLAEEIKRDGGVIPGVITIGVIDGKRFLLDGQHRREAFLIAECSEGFVDVRIHHFDSMAEMGEEFVNLNSQLVRMRPDDILRGLEGSNDALNGIRKACPFVGYDFVRRGGSSPIVSMSALLRCWFASSRDVPSSSAESTMNVVKSLTTDDAETLIGFLGAAYKAWGRDMEYHRLWGNLNLTIAMWVYRRIVLTAYSTKTQRISKEQFVRCLTSLSADSGYLDWLLGRSLRERDRSPCYQRIKSIFVRRLEQETGKKMLLPAPPWSSSSGRGTR